MSSASSEKLTLCLTQQAKERLCAAAQAQQQSIREFVLQSALEQAEEILADRRAFTLPPKQWAKFFEAFDAPPRPLPRLRKLLRQPGLFD